MNHWLCLFSCSAVRMSPGSVATAASVVSVQVRERRRCDGTQSLSIFIPSASHRSL